MKLTNLFIAIFCLFLTCCSKSDSPSENTVNAGITSDTLLAFSVKINGISFVASNITRSEMYLNGSYTYDYRAKDFSGDSTFTLEIPKSSIKLANQNIFNWPNTAFQWGNGNKYYIMGLNFFKKNMGHGTMSITGTNPNKNKFTGTFSGVGVDDDGDSVVFTNGKFSGYSY